MFNCLSRLYQPSRGDILLDGLSILPLPPHGMAGRGVGRTFQNVALFPRLSVLDNVRVGAHAASRGSLLADALGLSASRRRASHVDMHVAGLLRYLDLENVAGARCGDLPFGTQKRIELARALAMEPRLLLLDEPACGLTHREVAELGTLIRRIRDGLSLTVLLVEHHMGLVMSTADRVVALNFGTKLAEGTPAEIRSDAAVVEAYLGRRDG